MTKQPKIITQAIQAKLHLPCDLEPWKSRGALWLDWLTDTLFRLAGEVPSVAVKALLERVEGKVPLPVDVGGQVDHTYRAERSLTDQELADRLGAAHQRLLANVEAAASAAEAAKARRLGALPDDDVIDAEIVVPGPAKADPKTGSLWSRREHWCLWRCGRTGCHGGAIDPAFSPKSRPPPRGPRPTSRLRSARPPVSGLGKSSRPGGTGAYALDFAPGRPSGRVNPLQEFLSRA